MRRFEAEIRTFADKGQLLSGLEHLATYAPHTMWCKEDEKRLEALLETVKRKRAQQETEGGA